MRSPELVKKTAQNTARASPVTMSTNRLASVSAWLISVARCSEM